MKYTHYHPVTGERGTIINIPSEALRYKDQFEKVVGRLVSEFEYEDIDNMMTESTVVKLMDGTHFYFYDNEPSSVFKKEDGTMIQGYPDMPVCSEDPEKTTRVRIELVTGGVTLTPFKQYHRSTGLLQDIAEGKGAMYRDENQRLTVIPYHNIQKATIITAPYGG